jgi:YHS domain-containing protein
MTMHPSQNPNQNQRNQPDRGSRRSSTKQGAPDRNKPGGDDQRRTSDDAAWIDPVCGMNVREQSAIFSAEHDGETYRFCSEACRSKFEADPEQYAPGDSSI